MTAGTGRSSSSTGKAGHRAAARGRGCGCTTGTGAICNSLKVGAGDSSGVTKVEHEASISEKSSDTIHSRSKVVGIRGSKSRAPVSELNFAMFTCQITHLTGLWEGGIASRRLTSLIWVEVS